MAKHELPYASLDQAIQDKFDKIGGRDKAFTALKRGWYHMCHHDEKTKRDRSILAMVKRDPSILERVVDNKLERQLAKKQG